MIARLSLLDRIIGCVLLMVSLGQLSLTAAEFRPVSLQSRIARVQPMTGIVLWDTSEHKATDAVQLEFSYMKYSDVVSRRDEYDWSAVDKKLAAIASRGHQAILRFYFVYVGERTTIPAYIKALPDYHETRGRSEGKPTDFADWTHPELKRFTLAFYAEFAKRYDRDPRLAFLETGFGLWAEYHIYDGPMKLGCTFPDQGFQAEWLQHLSQVFKETPWMISIDAAIGEVGPFAARRELLQLNFGLFDDSFLCRQHPRENEPNWNFFGRNSYQHAPAGGEFSYYTKTDQKQALAHGGPHGVDFADAAKAFHITFMIGNDQPDHQPLERIREAGMACGYRFRVQSFQTRPGESRLTISNSGIAPIYYDAYVAVNGRRSSASLKGLQPGDQRECSAPGGGDMPVLTIECDRLVPGQHIDYEADLKASF